ncbi:MAG: isoprenylcysteine carboxylmethyltransferase family protein [Candidatus Tectomicrobia bacterium]|uniref:Isoprenylcysteine carboxylmethyltransferase family protein n=1 Tax=Tectimicrobiota bacterium TaxID=2528274 RepID=A0A932HV45_UNCTE|nr:isoprenylcysteine carboxylmethyltransferase family protein [Candidatus Tectomicrobia bacterium]
MPRWPVLLYGMGCYTAFLATVLYGAGFIADASFLPRTIDSGPPAPPGRAAAGNLALLALFGLQHSLMAREGLKRRWARLAPGPIERPTYVLASSLALILLYWGWRPLSAPAWEAQGPPGLLLLALHLAGWALVALATFQVNHWDLFGLRQPWLHFTRRPYTPLPLMERGLYRHIRHPVLSGTLLAIWAAPRMTQGRLLFCAGLTLYVLLAVRWEERGLLAAHGAAYAEYQRRVPRFVPGWGRWRDARRT